MSFIKFLIIVSLTFLSSSGIFSAVSDETVVPLKPWLRAESGVSFMRRNRDMSMIAYIPNGESGIHVIDTKSGNVYAATREFTGGSFFWSPDNARLFFRELIHPEGNKISTTVKAWDSALKKTVTIDAFKGSSGMLSFDPRDQRLMLMHEKGIMTKRLVFPDERLAYWQTAHRTDKGKFVAADGGMTYITQQGFAMDKMTDDNTGIESFDIAPNGDSVVWATKGGKIYLSMQGESARFLDFGRDPQWNPKQDLIIYAGGRMVGNKVAQYDLKMSASMGPGSFLTSSQERSERWPMWSPDGKAIIYTITGTTDILSLNLESKSGLLGSK